MSAYDQTRANMLADQLLSNSSPENVGGIVNELLSEFHRGYPLDMLKLFLQNRNTLHVRIGAWIASELGVSGSSLFDQIFPLLKSQDSYTRMYALACILLWADSSRGAEIASTLVLLDDPDIRIRRREMDFLSRLGIQQLVAVMSFIEQSDPKSKYGNGLRLLLQTNELPATAKEALQDKDGTIEKFGAVLARRIQSIDLGPLILALSSSNEDVKQFADYSMRLL